MRTLLMCMDPLETLRDLGLWRLWMIEIPDGARCVNAAGQDNVIADFVPVKRRQGRIRLLAFEVRRRVAVDQRHSLHQLRGERVKFSKPSEVKPLGWSTTLFKPSMISILLMESSRYVDRATRSLPVEELWTQSALNKGQWDS
ncbi:hypothetical protein WICPIJ_002232 [Wickerhamomyces pijperi]|uniref:Uncharacterized protein n=1 Tax=Wickerhamomyces pijperi TaxID=599730 RepID=A0A9P8TP56_WICPI|nr:hypothetical protein WICPIJ_002232 [Wickerhamomyces pijperi]